MNYKIINTVSNDRNDWRFNGQDKYLIGVNLKFIKFDRTIRDHDHCDFCTARFSEYDDDLHEGYCTLDNYYWICEKCFNDFNYMFHWKIVEQDGNEKQI